MAQAALVDRDIDWGRKVKTSLDAAKFPYSALLWLRQREEDDYFLIIASDLAARGPTRAYMELQKALRNVSPLDAAIGVLGQVKLVPERNPALSNLYAMHIEDSEVRISRSSFNNTFVFDAFIYKLRPPKSPRPTQ